MRKRILIVLIYGICFNLIGQSATVDIKNAIIDLEIDPYEEQINGTVNYKIQVLETSRSLTLNAKKINFQSVLLNGKKARYSYVNDSLKIRNKLREGTTYNLSFTYNCQPKQAVYFLGWKDSIPNNEQIWTQGQGKDNSHWLPGFDDLNKKIKFETRITFDSSYQVLSNGILKNSTEHKGLKTWTFSMDKPMSSYLLAFSIGKYERLQIKSSSGIPINLYYYPSDSILAEPTYRYTATIFNSLEEQIGIPYPWQHYQQVPVRDFLYAGMENTGLTIFSDALMTDSIAFVDRNYVNVNAHELAHQWFGNLVTEVDASSHWLHEGFATFYALEAERSIFGDAYYYWQLYNKVKTLEAISESGGGESLVDPKASSLTFYDKGALAVIMLREILGESLFKKGIKQFLETYAYKNATVSNLMSIMQNLTSRPLDEFKAKWLLSEEFPKNEAWQFLRKNSPEINDFLKLQSKLSTSPQPNGLILKEFWDTHKNAELRSRLIDQYHASLSIDFLKEAFLTEDLKIRQALALIPGSIPEELIANYENLLNDHSYITVEHSLYKLWIQRPEHRVKYLDQTRNLVGFRDLNIKQLWLLLASLTGDYGTEMQRRNYKTELFGYTSAVYPVDVRQLAFSWIGEVYPYEDQNLKDLVNAAVHPVWQFRQFARRKMDQLLEQRDYKNRLIQILDTLEGEEHKFLLSKLTAE